MKRRFAAIIALATLCTTLAACSGGNSDKLKLGIWPQDTAVEEIALHREWVTAFNKKHPDIKVVPAYYDYAADTFVQMAESGNLPTVFQTWFTEPKKLIAGEFVADISKEVAAKGWDAVMAPAIRELLSGDDGKLYGIPRDGYALGLMINMQLFRQAGLVGGDGLPLYPKTLDELAQTAKIIKDETGRAGLVFPAKNESGGWQFSNIAWNYGATLQEYVNGKWVSYLDSPECVAAMQWLKSLKWDYGVLTDDPTMENWDSGFTKLGTGDAAMYIAGSDAVRQPTYTNGLPLGDLAMVPVPAGPGGRYCLLGGTPYMFAKGSSSKIITAALDYLEIMGKTPTVTEESLAGMRKDAEYRKNEGIPVLPSLRVWNDAAYLAAEQRIIEEYSNVDYRLYADFYADMDVMLRSEEPQLAQDMYAEFTKVIQECMVNRDADVPALMARAQKNFQGMLDDSVNK